MLATLLLTATATVSQYGNPVCVFDPHALNWEERTTAECLQGLVNRDSAALFLGRPDDEWLEIYAADYGLPQPVVLGSLREVLERYASAAKGLVVYDAAMDGTRYVAVTIAGIEDLLPVADPEMAEGLGLPVIHDLRGRFESTLAAYDWALDEVMPRCNRRLAHAVDGVCDGVVTGLCSMTGFDWQVANRGFVFNLTPMAEVKPSYGDAPVGGSPEHAAMYRRILAALEAPAEINGYGEPEDLWCKLISEHGHFSFHFGFNWTFHAKAPYRGGAFRQRGAVTVETAEIDPEKYQVVFMLSEGDTMKGPLPFFMGSWFDPDRGSIPFNWGINPLMAERFPAMLDYYYRTATDNDCFFAGCSGAGYCYPDHMPNVAQFARLTAEHCERADVSTIDLWGARSAQARIEYGDATRPLSLSNNGGTANMTMPSPPLPVIDHGLLYWQHASTPEGPHYNRAFRDDAKRAQAVAWVTERIEQIANAHTPPFVILVYADLHSYDRHVMVHREVAESLDPERFEICRLDTAVAGFRQWAQGRLLFSAGGINSRLEWAGLEGVPTRIDAELINPNDQAMGAELTWQGTGAVFAASIEVPALGQETIPDLMLALPRGAGIGDGAFTVATDARTTVYPVTVCAVPYRGDASAVRLAGLWGMSGLSHAVGKPLAREDAHGGTAWRSPDPGETGGHIVCGPYVEMPPGRYHVAYRMRLAEEPPAGDPVAVSLDVNTGGYAGLGAPIGDRPIAASALSTKEWRWVSTEVDWPGSPSLMESRVYWPSHVPVIVDRVAVFQIENAPTSDRAGRPEFLNGPMRRFR